MKKLPKKIIAYLNSITDKRPKTVIQHLLKHGKITSEELKELYGYEHPPRAIRDVRELGIPIKTTMVKGTQGRKIASYCFGDFSKAENKLAKSAGRTALSRALKKALIKKYGSKCFVYLEEMNEDILQVDHRIPFEIGGEHDEKDIDYFMLLSPSANRAKSWSCEHCPNWDKKDISFCMRCFWSHPEDYDHAAGRYEKIISLVFTGDEIEDYDKLIKQFGEDNAQDFIKKIIHNNIK